MSRGFKTHNEYAAAIMDYNVIPKAVFAAVAYSFAVRIFGDDGAESPTLIEAAILDEWTVLHKNGIVPQKPPTGNAAIR